MVQNEPAKIPKRTFGAIFVRFHPKVYLYVIITLCQQGAAQYAGKGLYTVHCTVYCIHNQIVFEEMSSWTALTMHLGMKTIF